jgi:DNA-binding NarL/FixJ family response regulator
MAIFHPEIWRNSGEPHIIRNRSIDSAWTAPEMERTQLLLLGEDLLFREALERSLSAEPDLTVAGSCRIGEEARAVLEQRAVALILLDLDGCLEAAFEFLAKRRPAGGAAKILVLTQGLSPALTVRALQLGVAGIFVKSRGLDAMLSALRLVTTGEAWLEPEAIRLLADGVRTDLAPHEEDILRGVLEGLTNAQIAEQMALPESVVKAALQRLFHKAGVRTKGQLIRAAMEGMPGAAKK